MGVDGCAEVKQPVVEMIGELIDEIKNVYTQIAEQAIEHIHAKEVIMTYAQSKTVTAFLKEVFVLLLSAHCFSSSTSCLGFGCSL